MCFPGEVWGGERNCGLAGLCSWAAPLIAARQQVGAGHCPVRKAAFPAASPVRLYFVSPAMIATPEDAPRRLAPASMSAIASS